MLVFDIETTSVDFKLGDWLSKRGKRVHVLVIGDTFTGQTQVYRDNDLVNPIEDGLSVLEDAPVIAGHNIHRFDIPYLQTLYPWFRPKGFVRDSFVESCLYYPAKDLYQADIASEKKYGTWIPRGLFGRHSLEAWGARLGFPKDDYAARMKEKGHDPWAVWNQDMEDYCVIDVQLNMRLFNFFAERFPEEKWEQAFELENRLARILAKQEHHGVRFDLNKAASLLIHLMNEREQLAAELREEVGSFYVRDGTTELIPKKDSKTGYVAGAPLNKVKLVEFNPASRDHVALVLRRQYGWKPADFTDKGKPQVDEGILSKLTYPLAPKLARYFMLEKRLGQLHSGNEAWLKQVTQEGYIHGTVNANGTRTGRASHSNPNLGQVPRVGQEYGAESRELFCPDQGHLMVGVDLSGIEMRALAHYLARWDKGKFAETALHGDIHTEVQKGIGFNSRNNTKTAEYAYLYGAGDHKLGTIVYEDLLPDQRQEVGRGTHKAISKLGAVLRVKLERSIHGLEALNNAVRKKTIIKALDGRPLKSVSEHSALNTLLQGFGGILAKYWIIQIDNMLQARGIVDDSWLPSGHCQQVLWVHDEVQFSVKPELAEVVKQTCEDAARIVGEYLDIRVPIAAEGKVGSNWKETH